jgi:hypothetical protein
MKPSRNKVAYKKPSKRSPLVDIPTDAARRAKVLEAEKHAKSRLRVALGNPTDSRGKPVAGHVVTKIAADQLLATSDGSTVLDFEYLAHKFMSGLSYRHGFSIPVAGLWNTFIRQVEAGDADFAVTIARGFETAFRWYLAGYIHLIESDYAKLPHSIEMIEIWDGIKGHRLVAVQRDGNRRALERDQAPEHPALIRAGTKIYEFVARQDLRLMKQIGNAKFLAELKTGKRALSPRALILMTEDTLINIQPPSPASLEAFRQQVASCCSLNKRWLKRRKRVT